MEHFTSPSLLCKRSFSSQVDFVNFFCDIADNFTKIAGALLKPMLALLFLRAVRGTTPKYTADSNVGFGIDQCTLSFGQNRFRLDPDSL